MPAITYVLFGYISGSVLYAKIFAQLFRKKNLFDMSKDKNPGTSNAFLYGGFWCGTLTLVCDLLKGFFPVFLYFHGAMRVEFDIYAALVIAAPVIGHIYPLLYGFKGGKGIATTFGCLLGLLPMWQPLAVLAGFFIFFSVVCRITPHFHRTLATYFASVVSMVFLVDSHAIRLGFAAITAAVCFRLLSSREEKEKMEVRLFWRH